MIKCQLNLALNRVKLQKSIQSVLINIIICSSNIILLYLKNFRSNFRPGICNVKDANVKLPFVFIGIFACFVYYIIYFLLGTYFIIFLSMLINIGTVPGKMPLI